MKKTIYALLLTLTVINFSCRKEIIEEPVNEPDKEIIVAENTRIIDEQTRNIITAIDTTNYTFTVNGNSDIISNLQTGDIIVDDVSDLAPYGYLRKVKTINNSGEETIITTEPATLIEAIPKGKISFNTGRLSMAQVKHYKLGKGVSLNNSKDTDFSVFSLDYEEVFENENGEITISGHTDFEMEYFFDFDWEMNWLALPPQPVIKAFETGILITQTASVNMVCEAGAGIQKRISLAEFYFTPWTIMAGPVPVVFVPRIELFLEMDGSIIGVLTASATENFQGRLGTKYSDEDGWNKIKESTYEKDYVAPNLTAGAQFTTHIGPEVSLLLYGIGGPFVNFTACSQVDASLITGSENWNLTFLVGVQAEVGMLMNLLGFNDHWTPESFCLFSETLMQLNDEPFGNNIYISYPVDGQYYLQGEDISITTSFTGETPDEIEFYYDYNLVYTDTQPPFEYTLNTDNEAEGSHVIRISAKINDVEIASDNLTFYLAIPVWDRIDLSNLGLNQSTNTNDIFFTDLNNGWMTVDGNGVGKVLKTNDAGMSWSEIYSSAPSLKQVVMFNSSEGIFLNGYDKVMYTSDGGQSMTQLTYGQYNQPSFQWKDIFMLTANNESNEIIAVGKDTGIPYQFSVYRVDKTSYAPTGYFNLPYPNEYGTPPKIIMNGNSGVLYDVYDENNPNNSYYMTTTDGGITWQGFQFNIINADTKLHGAYMPNQNHVWIVGEENDEAIVLISNDGGSTWDKVNLLETPVFSSVFFTSNNEGYATVKDSSSSAEAKLYHTIDGGYTWNPMLESSSTYGMSKVYFLGQDFGIVSGYGPEILRYSM